MTFRFMLAIDGDARGAKLALEQTAVAAGKTGAAIKAIGPQAASSTPQVAVLQAEIVGLRGQIDGLTDAEARATGQVAVLTEQLVVQESVMAKGMVTASRSAGALAGSFMAILNPVGLITTAVLIAGTAMVQWLVGGKSDAEELEESVDALTGAVDSYSAAVKSASVPLSDLVKQYGSLSAEARELLELEKQMTRVQAERKTALASRNISEMFGASKDSVAQGDDLATTLLRTLALGDIGGALGMTTGQAEEALVELQLVAEALDALASAEGPQAQAAAFADLAGSIDVATGGVANMTDETFALYQQLLDAAQGSLELVGSIEKANPALQTLHDLAVLAAGGVADIGVQADGIVGKLSNAASAAWNLASAVVAGLKQGGADMEGVLAYNEVTGGGRGASSGGPPIDPYGFRGDLNRGNKPTDGAGSGRSGGGASAASAESDAVDRLIKKLELETELKQALDPVARAMIQNREALASATDAERARIEELIGINARLDQINERREAFTTSLNQSLMDIIFSGEGVNDMLEDMIGQLARAFAQAALLGTGPLAGIFGAGDTGGGLIGAISSFLFPKAATGGLISGPGGPRDDKVPFLLSDGEYVVNAEATSHHRALLDAINGGASLPGMKAGGPIGISPTYLPAMGVPSMLRSQSGSRVQEPARIEIDLRLSDDLNARIESKSSEISAKHVHEGLKAFNNKVLPQRVMQIAGDNRARA